MLTEFTATLVRSPAKGGWTYVVWLPVKAAVRKAIGKDVGDQVHIRLDARL